jgi:hypothetical protein
MRRAEVDDAKYIVVGYREAARTRPSSWPVEVTLGTGTTRITGSAKGSEASSMTWER